MTNDQDAIVWFRMALADIDRILRSFQAKDYSDCVFRIQFCSEKILKGLILLYGAQFKKIHTPSLIIRDEILQVSSKLSKIEIKNLEKLIDNAKILEDLSTIPRYGIDDKGKFIEPEAIYKEENSVILIIPNILNILNSFIEILTELKQNNVWKKIMEDFKNEVKRLQSLINKK